MSTYAWHSATKSKARTKLSQSEQADWDDLARAVRWHVWLCSYAQRQNPAYTDLLSPDGYATLQEARQARVRLEAVLPPGPRPGIYATVPGCTMRTLYVPDAYVAKRAVKGM